MGLARLMMISGVVLACAASWSLGILATDYTAVHILEPPAVHPLEDCEQFSPGNHPCGAGPGYAGGISNAGDVVGPLETNHPYEEPWPELGRWLRSNGYKGENMRRFEVVPGSTYTTGSGHELPYPGPESAPLAYGFIRVQKVTSDGFMYGSANIGNGSLARYDIVNDAWWSFGFGVAGGGNNKGRMVSGWKHPGALFGEHGSRVVDASLVSNEPIDPAGQGDLQAFPNAVIFGPAIFANDINDNDIIVGSFDDIGGGFPNVSDPIKMLPDGTDHWDADNYVVMDELREDSRSRATRLSDSEPAFAIGWSTVDGVPHGVLWDVSTGQIKADFGPDVSVCANKQTCGPSAINSAGTMVVGARLNKTVFPPVREHFVWSSADGWKTFEEVTALSILETAEGGEHIEAVTRLTGINDIGQISAQALIKGEFGEYLTPGISAWDPAIATNESCPNSDDGEWIPDNGCGIPIVLDTRQIEEILKGDINNDGFINNLDITSFIAALAAEDEADFLQQFPQGNYIAADLDQSGQPDNLDITPFIGLLTSAASGAAVPEPGSGVLIALTLMMLSRRQPRKGIAHTHTP